MKHFSLVVSVVVAIAVLAVFSVPAEAEHDYVGVSTCKMCHKKEDKGAQFQKWEESSHAQAYNNLASAKAKEVAAAKGIANPQESPDCLKCHVTGYGADPSRFGKKYKQEDGVGCESCHGPGKDYKNIKVMKDVEQAKANGLIISNAETCKECHNEESPTFTGFDYEEKFAQIAHPRP